MNNMNECSFVLVSFIRVGINDEKKEGLQQFGVIPFEIRTLKKPHTEKRRTRRIVYYKAIC